MKTIIKAITDILTVAMTGKSDRAVADGICDYSGQGR